ncbi:MAG: hypothetical protein JST94_05945 [Bacteroidetes bacterium]|nr:hypothetical protein [Bacteroidota bacterium]MBS1670979.1 hypothetical protein [Bacteroidota bacterium]
MKKITVVLCCILFSFIVKAQTVDEIFAKYDTAVGGITAMNKLITLQYKSVITMKMMGNSFDVTVNNYRENNKLYRREVQGIMGMRNSYSLLTDTAGYLYIPPMRSFGGGGGAPPPPGFDAASQQPLTKMTDKNLAEQLYQLDCAGPFGYFVNYAAKGHKAELVGSSKVNKEECYKVKFTLKSGQEMTYYFSKTSGLVLKMDCIGKIALDQFGIGPIVEQMGTSASKMKVSILYSDYQDIGNGVKFPMKEMLEVGAAEIGLVNSDFINNVEIDAKYYKTGNSGGGSKQSFF